MTLPRELVYADSGGGETSNISEGPRTAQSSAAIELIVDERDVATRSLISH